MSSLKKSSYVFDSGPLIDLRNYPRDIFPTVWSQLESMFESGQIVSSTEVFKELEIFDDEVATWAKGNKKHFIRPCEKEQIIIANILGEHPELIRQTNITSGRAVADPFVIAQAQHQKRTLVHREKFKPNAHNIPNICKDRNIANIGLFEFFREVKWQF